MEREKIISKKFEKDNFDNEGAKLFVKLVEQSYKKKEELLKRMINIRREWEHFTQHGEITKPGIVREEVLESWKKCWDEGVDPTSVYDRFLNEEDFQKKKNKNKILLQAAIPLLQAMADSIEGSGFRIDLYDKDLILMSQKGDQEVLKMSKNRGSTIGVQRKEAYSGTNASSLVLKHRKPFQLVGPEHYKKFLHYWTCSAAPILSPEGQIVGVINIAGHSGLMHQHTQGLAIFLSRAIAQNMQQQELTKELKDKQNYILGIIDSMGEGLITIDEDDKIALINKEAEKILNLPKVKILGQKIETVFGPENPFSTEWMEESPLVDRELTLNIKGKRKFFVGKTRIVKNRLGKKNVIGVFRTAKTTKGFVKTFSGFQAHFTFEDLIGASPHFNRAVQLAKQAAPMQSSVLLQGESGTGKDLIAQSIHNASNNHSGPFVAINCAAIPGELFESELFGYEGGAFTGAKKEGRPGKFELADGGTLFLDEIGSMPLTMQAKLLRALENQSIMRVGGVTEIPYSARIIVASNQNLIEAIRMGKFREDLFYRINIIHITIPPLRQRLEDIPVLVKYFCQKISSQINQDIDCSQKAIDALKKQRWPGNVRELENMIERAAFLALNRGSQIIEPEDLIDYSSSQEINSRTYSNISKANLKKIEKETIIKALTSSGGNISKAADYLGVARNTLYRKMKKHQINPKEFK